MRTRAQIILALGGVGVLLGCQAAPPNMEHALTLYRDGQINEARREMVLYTQAQPSGMNVDIARQHILLIRRIKAMEHTAVEQWLQGDSIATRRTISILRFLHPVYIDSAKIFRVLLFQQPTLTGDPVLAARDLPEFDLPDSTLQRLLPASLATLNRQEEVIIYMARQWALIKNRAGDQQIRVFARALSSPEVRELLQAVDTAYLELQGRGNASTPLVQEINLLSEEFDRLLADLQAGTFTSLLVFEYQFHGSKRELLRKILAIKARIGTSSLVVG